MSDLEIETIVLNSGDGIESSLELYPSKHTEKCGCILVLPGGSYSHLAAHEGTPVAEHFAEMGFFTAVCRYRTAPSRYPAPLDDVSAAIGYLRNNADRLNINPEKIAILGFSAGGHLAAMSAHLLPEATRPDAAILCYPVLTPEAHIGSYRNLLGAEFEASHPDYQKFSWVKQASSASRPTFIFHREEDIVDVRSVMDYAKALRSCQVPVELHVFTGGSHGVGLGKGPMFPEVRVWPDLAAAFLRHYGW